MKKLAHLLLICCTASHFAVAASETTPPTETAAVPAKTDAPPVLELKHKSSFELEENGRNPFWPIGWKPAPKKAAAETADSGPSADISAAQFNVTSITLDAGAKFAIINGKVMAEGQVFGLQAGSQVYQITVKSIQDGRVVLLRRNEEIEVPLRRR
jgi:hypothetical protein